MTTELLAALDAAWQPARLSGALGSATIEDLRRHSAGFVAAVLARFGPDHAGKGADIGTGAGLPGAFVAWALPLWEWVLVDSSARRCELAEAATAALKLSDRVTVLHSRAEETAADLIRPDELPDGDVGGPFDAVTARLFGSPAETVEVGLSLAASGGVLVASIREADRTWWETLPQRLTGVASAQVSDREGFPFASVARGPAWSRSLPRRPAARRRRPLA